MNLQQSKPSFKTILPLLAILVLILVIAWIAGAFSVKLQQGSEQKVINIPAKTSPSFTVQLKKIKQVEVVSGSIEAKQDVEISARILAGVEKIYVSSGDYVTKGQLLVELENKDLKSRLDQAQAKLQSINARLNEAKKTLQRTQELSSKGMVSKAQLDASKANYDAANANRTNSLQAVKEAKTFLSYAMIRSPIDGLIIDKHVESGDTVQPAQTILSLFNPDSVRVEANVRESLAVRLKDGDIVKVTIPSINKKVSSSIEEIVPAANSASRSFLVKAALKDVTQLRPGMYAKLLIPFGYETKLIIPSNYIKTVGQLDVVWVEEEGMLSRRFIRTGEQTDKGFVEIISGLHDGDVVHLYKH